MIDTAVLVAVVRYFNSTDNLSHTKFFVNRLTFCYNSDNAAPFDGGKLEEGGDIMLESLTQLGLDVVAIVVGGLILDYIINKRR